MTKPPWANPGGRAGWGKSRNANHHHFGETVAAYALAPVQQTLFREELRRVNDLGTNAELLGKELGRQERQRPRFLEDNARLEGFRIEALDKAHGVAALPQLLQFELLYNHFHGVLQEENTASTPGDPSAATDDGGRRCSSS